VFTLVWNIQIVHLYLPASYVSLMAWIINLTHDKPQCVDVHLVQSVFSLLTELMALFDAFMIAMVIFSL